MSNLESPETAFQGTINAICKLPWSQLSEPQCVDAAWAYYYFSIQFRENLQIARRLHPGDEKLIELDHAECDTDNLSPWPGVALAGERMNHDEFMRRSLALGTISEPKRAQFSHLGDHYLALTRAADDITCAMSIASYEDGGLESVFTAMLAMPEYSNPVLAAFRHFLSEHIRFDSDPDEGHGALARHLGPDDRIKPLWDAFHALFVGFIPELAATPALSATEAVAA